VIDWDGAKPTVVRADTPPLNHHYHHHQQQQQQQEEGKCGESDAGLHPHQERSLAQEIALVSGVVRAR
jgi:hypothetical protein